MAGNTGAEEERPTTADWRRLGAFLVIGRSADPYYQLFPSSHALGAPLRGVGQERNSKGTREWVVSENILCSAAGVSLLRLKRLQ